MFGFCIAVFLPWLVFTSTVHKPKHFLTCSFLHSFDSKDEKRIQYVSPEPEGTGHRDFPKKCKIWDQIQSPVFAFFWENLSPIGNGNHWRIRHGSFNLNFTWNNTQPPIISGKLLKPGEEATSYSDMEDDDEEASNNESADKKNDWWRWSDGDECCEPVKRMEPKRQVSMPYQSYMKRDRFR